MSEIKDFTSAPALQEHWISKIAPNYFDLNDINNYRVGLFGYVNEVMSNTTLDTHNAMKIARREFYPITATKDQSLYKMAATQKMSLPMTTAATCKAVLLIPQDEVIANSVFIDDVYSCTIDNSMKIMADNIPFLLDYPINILSKKTNNEWKHTIHYDATIKNSLSDISNTYIVNKVIFQDGRKYILMSVTLRQLEFISNSQLVTRDANIDTVSLLYPFEGDIANFDVFYNEDPEGNNPIKLMLVSYGAPTPKEPFCYYRLLNPQLLQITVPKNLYFMPMLNSEIRVNIFTSLGKDGEFKVYNGPLACTLQSDRYPYNNNMSVTGIVNGSSTGGVDKPDREAFRSMVMDVYSTNNTTTTSNDLQIYFDRLSRDPNNRINFTKKRSDPLIRLYGAYCLLKDRSSNVVPTNDLTIELKISDFDSYNTSSKRGFIKPGSVFEYLPDTEDGISYRVHKSPSIKISDNLDVYDDNSKFLFTNPFLIAVNMEPNIVGFYYNALDTIKEIEYSYINDNTLMQFIGSSLNIYRNPITKENFYKFHMKISPATELDPNTVIEINPSTDEANIIRAPKNGKVISLLYNEDHVVCTVEYIDGTEQTIDVGSYVSKKTAPENGFEYHTGYKMNFGVYESFVEGDILAVKKVTDKGVLRACMDFSSFLFENEYYIPMVIEDYDEELNTYTIAGYISTDDVLSLDSTILINHGIFNQSSDENEYMSIPMSNILVNISVFYKNDSANFTHKYSNFNYFATHSLTNIYSENPNNPLSLVQQIDFIRSTVVFEEIEDEEEDFKVVIKEAPVAKANWVKDVDNFSYLTNAIYDNYNSLYETYFLLENNFGIDLKFYNTYGKSRFYKVGIMDQFSMLANVNCSFKFGIHLTTISNQDNFLEQFRLYIKEYVESINTNSSTGQSIYIMNLIGDVKQRFPEIGYIEYYGFNNYGYDAQKIIPIENSELNDEQKVNYIPEFINIYSYKQDDGIYVPKIEVTFLD